jgi:putative transposase
MPRRPYRSHLSDAEFAQLDPLLPTPKPWGRPWAHSLREILDGIFYVVRTGCQWRQLLHEFPPWPTMYLWFRRFRLDGALETLNAALRELARRAVGRHPQPSAAILDSQSFKTTSVGGVRGYDGAKKLSGRKRHVLVETQGLLLTVRVHSAELQDRAAVPLVLADAHECFPRVAHVWVDRGYTRHGQAVDRRTSRLDGRGGAAPAHPTRPVGTPWRSGGPSGSPGNACPQPRRSSAASCPAAGPWSGPSRGSARAAA